MDKKKLKEQFRKEHPETIGEADTTFDDYNYFEWVEKKYIESLKELIKQEGIEEKICITCHYNKPKKYVICKKCIHNLSDYWLTKD